MGGEERTLTAYRAGPEEERFWVPFRDETNGGATYGAGRYLDLDPEDRTDDGAGRSTSAGRTAPSARSATTTSVLSCRWRTGSTCESRPASEFSRRR